MARKPPAPAGTDKQLWSDLMQRILDISGTVAPIDRAQAESVAYAQALVQRLSDAESQDDIKQLCTAISTLRQSLAAFDKTIQTRQSAANPGSPGGTGKRRQPARDGVATTGSVPKAAPRTWIDDVVH
jgi:hypothetical protein